MTAQGRAAQRAWLLEHFPADEVIVTANIPALVRDQPTGPVSKATFGGERLAALWRSWLYENVVVRPCCRCYRCGRLLIATAIFPDKVDPNGTTRRSNLRPACSEHVGMTPPRGMTDAQVAEATRRHRRESPDDLAAALRRSFERRAGVTA